MNMLVLKTSVAVLVAGATVTKAAFTITKARTVYKSKKLMELHAETAGAAK